MRRKILLCVLMLLAVVCMVPCGFFVMMVLTQAGSSAGSPELAAEWRDYLNQFENPDAAVAANPDIHVIKCKNGEWVFGLAQSSHGVWLRGGGTTVVKDSSGRTRAFFGHVCGSDLCGGGGYGEIKSLDDHYQTMVERNLTEHTFP